MWRQEGARSLPPLCDVEDVDPFPLSYKRVCLLLLCVCVCVVGVARSGFIESGFIGFY